MTDINELRRLAEAQENKEWVRDDGRLSLENGQRMYGVDGPGYVSCWEDYGFTRAAAAFIAAANPKAILELIAENERLEQELSETELRALKFIHQCNAHVELYRELREERDQLRAEVEGLRSLLAEAASDVADWGAYASDYFQQKHDLAGCVAKYRAAMGKGGHGNG